MNYQEEVERLKKELDTLKREVVAVIDLCPGAVRVCEGGGPEDIAASLAVTVASLRNDLNKFKSLTHPANERQAVVTSLKDAEQTLTTLRADKELLMELVQGYVHPSEWPKHLSDEIAYANH